MLLLFFAGVAFFEANRNFALAQVSDTHCGTPTLPRCTDAAIHLTNKWSGTTTDPETRRGTRTLLENPSARRYAGDETYVYATAREFHSSGAQLNFIHQQADILVVTLHDEDRNLPVPVIGGMLHAWSGGSNNGNIRVFTVANEPNLPIIDYSNDGRINSADLSITVASGGAELSAISAVNWEFNGAPYARVTVYCFSSCSEETFFTLGWSTSEVDQVDVSVSVTEGSGGRLTLTETGIDTGTFEGEVYITDALSPFAEAGRRTVTDNRERLTITAIHASRITARYTDRVRSTRRQTVSVRAVADMEPPEVFIANPEHDSHHQSGRTEFNGYFDDAGAGLLISSGSLYIDTSDDSDNSFPVLDFNLFAHIDAEPPIRPGVIEVESDNLRLRDARDGSIGEPWKHRGTTISSDGLTDFVARIDDLAGNIGFSDAVPEEFGTQPHLLIVASEAPKMLTDLTVSGESWDARRGKIEIGDRRSVKLVFNAPLDATAITHEDFAFTDTVSAKVFTPAAVLFPELPSLDYRSPPEERALAKTERRLLRRTLFFHFLEDLPSHGRLIVEIVGEISDLAGNTATPQNSRDVVTADGISPVPIISLTGGSGIGGDHEAQGSATLTNNRMDILISADERIRRPEVYFSLPAEEGETTPALGGAATVRRNTRGMWQANFTPSLLPVDADGEVAVSVFVEDYSGNSSCLYAAHNSPALSLSPCNYVRETFVKFTFDKTPPKFTNSRMSTFSTKPPVVIDWNEKVHRLEATLLARGGERSDISHLLITSNNKDFVWSPDFDLPFGTYTLEASATDIAGNHSGNIRQSIQVIERKPFSLAVSEGWNAISLPSNPISAAVEDVFKDSAVDAVLSYETWRSSENWRTAFKRNGSWNGDLKEIKRGVGYFIRSSDYDVVEIPLKNPISASPLTVPDTPPAVPLFTGWNFVGVLSANIKDIITDSGAPLHLSGSETVADMADYLSLPYSAAYRIIGDGGEVFLYHSIGAGDPISLGQALWVYLLRPGDATARVLSPP